MARTERVVTVREASEQLSELVEQAVAGASVVIVRDRVPVVRLVPVVNGKGRPRFGSAKGLIAMSDDFNAPLDDFAHYRE